ncbi:nudix hydrolase 12, mitochondrial-like [Phoenix dactylifera]|uniref:Nudix hydrolase 12, mitochondrial-like n=1 Tax=Phoenix dactylifera TaxID=42345 RepID=A0A8B8ZZ92_PHODC|nr:nudix hydrolase 12, mitochondrial-like [Phoenix dactylifera]
MRGCCSLSGIRELVITQSMSSVVLARTGRHRQRYQDHFRLVAGCIPYKQKANTENHSDDLIDCLEVLMISSPNRVDLVFPKGGWENDETVHDAACREALEEAGVRGIINFSVISLIKTRICKNAMDLSLDYTMRGQEGKITGYMDF